MSPVVHCMYLYWICVYPLSPALLTLAWASAWTRKKSRFIVLLLISIVHFRWPARSSIVQFHTTDTNWPTWGTWKHCKWLLHLVCALIVTGWAFSSNHFLSAYDFGWVKLFIHHEFVEWTQGAWNSKKPQWTSAFTWAWPIVCVTNHRSL